MGKLTSNGPDWVDVMMFVNALDAIHECRTGILITTAGQGHNGSMHIALITNFDVVPGSSLTTTVTSESDFPCKQCATLPAHIYAGLYKHDFAIGEAYQQRHLPGVA